MASADIGAVQSQQQLETQRQQRARANDDSLLLRKIPPEVRNRIYESIIGDGQIINVHGDWTYMDYEGIWAHENLDEDELDPVQQHPKAITQVCQQLRDETIAMFYARSVFVVYVDPALHYPFQEAKQWARSLASRALGALTHLILRDSDPDGEDHRCVEVVRFNLKNGQVQALGDWEGCAACCYPRPYARRIRWLERHLRTPSQVAQGTADAKRQRILRLIKKF